MNAPQLVEGLDMDVRSKAADPLLVGDNHYNRTPPVPGHSQRL